MKIFLPPLNNRLKAAADFVRKGSVFADIGTDHAYLPIWLVLNGISISAAAADINKGPLLRAEKNIRQYGLSNKIKTILSDGLNGLDKYGFTDIAICGMGGDLIASILDNSDFIKNENINLILQPMSAAERLRAYLISHKFKIIDETIASAENKLYQCLRVQYDSDIKSPPEYSKAQLLIGKSNIEKSIDNIYFTELVSQWIKVQKKIIDGKKIAGLDISDEQDLLNELIFIKDNTENDNS